MKNQKNAFTMIELIFVILILGILSAVAVPKFNQAALEAEISSAKADIASIRSGIVSERQTRLITGDASWISNANLDTGNGDFFGGVLMYGISASTGNSGWSGTAGSGTYTLSIAGSNNTFDYNSTTGTFNCTAGNECSDLTN